MQPRSLSHLSDTDLLHAVESLSSRQRRTTAELILHLAEVDRRKLHLRHAHPSLTRYCINALHMSVDAAFKHARAARMARRYPAILSAVAEGRLHLSAIVMLAPYLERGPADALLQAAEHRTKSQLALLLAERFPQQDVPTSVRAIPAVLALDSECSRSSSSMAVADSPTSQLAPGPVLVTVRPHLVAPRSPGRFELRLTLGQAAHDKLVRAKELLSHSVPSGDLAAVIERALDVLVVQLEKRVCAATTSPRRRPPEGEAKGRYVPAEVRRDVWLRDEGRCTFEGPSGTRCGSRSAVQIDHVVPYAMGGRTSVENLRLLCRAHNRWEAERVFGEKRIEGREEQARAQQARQRAQGRSVEAARAEAQASGQPAPTESTSGAPGHSNARAHVDEVLACLLTLKFTRQEARCGAEMSAHMPEASLEERVRVALQGLGRPRFQRCTHTPDFAGGLPPNGTSG